MPDLGIEEQTRLLSCIEEIRNVVGESVSENRLTQTVLEHDFDCAKALDAILNLAVSSAAASSSLVTPASVIPALKPETSKGEFGLHFKQRFIILTICFLFFFFHIDSDPFCHKHI